MRVLIAGGGVAALEGLLALRDVAEDRVEIELLAAVDTFTYRPLEVGAPFALGKARAYDLERIAAARGATFVKDALQRVDADERTVLTRAGEELGFDALLIAIGCRQVERVTGAITYGGRREAPAMRRLLADVAAHRVARIAFVVPPATGWMLPAYELALLTAADATERGAEPEITLVTPEDAPLALFGRAASAAAGELLEQRGIRFRGETYAARVDGDELVLSPGQGRLAADRVVALPALAGPAVPGLPSALGGFLRTDPHGRVRDVEGVWAAGDAVDFPIKQGGLAAQQADAAAQDIAAAAGAPVEPAPFRPVLRGMLLTGAQPRYLRHTIAGGAGDDSLVADHALWWPPGKIAGRYLGPYLGAPHEQTVVTGAHGVPIEVRLEREWLEKHPQRPAPPSPRRAP